MADVFLSYSREDQALAGRLVELLEGRGWDVFWDQETRAGALWPKVLEDELNRARCLIVLWTAHSVASRWVRIEANEALQCDKLLPVRIDNVKPPMEFRQTQTLDLVGWTGEPTDPRLPRLFEDLGVLARCTPRRREPAAAASVAAPAAESASLEVREPPIAAVAAGEPPHDLAEVTQRPVPAPPSTVARGDPNRSAGAGRPQPVLPALPLKVAVAAGLAAVVVAALWWLQPAPVVESETAVAPRPPGVVSAPTDKPAVTVTDVRPAPQVSPAAGSTTAIPAAGGVAADPPPRVAAGPARTILNPDSPERRSLPRDTAKPAHTIPARCIAIADKFQTTGQLTDEERRFLSSTECAK
jgi:hypothetical protein